MSSAEKPHGTPAKSPKTVSPFAHLSLNAIAVAIARASSGEGAILRRAARPSQMRKRRRSAGAADDAPVLRRDEPQHAPQARFVELQCGFNPEIGDARHFFEGHGIDEAPRAIERAQGGIALAAATDEIIESVDALPIRRQHIRSEEHTSE